MLIFFLAIIGVEAKDLFLNPLDYYFYHENGIIYARNNIDNMVYPLSSQHILLNIITIMQHQALCPTNYTSNFIFLLKITGVGIALSIGTIILDKGIPFTFGNY